MRKRSLFTLVLLGVLSAAAFGQSNLLTVAGGGPPNGATATSISISSARGVAVDATGNVYIAASSQNRVYVVATNGTVSVLAGTGVAGSSGDGGAAVNAQLNAPMGIAVDSTGTNVYIADSYNNRIRKVTGGVITTVAGVGTLGYVGDGGAATSAQLYYPYSVAVDSSGNLYIADTFNSRIRKVSGGIITTVAGTGYSGYSGDAGQAAAAQINNPYGVAVDGSSNLYIADTSNGVIRKVTGGVITTVAGGGFSGLGDGGAATAAQLSQPNGVAVDGSGNLYIADTGDYRVRKVSGGIITTVAGNGSMGFLDGGTATSSPLSPPAGVAVNSAGTSLYIADLSNNRIRKVAAGIISTVAGNGTAGYSGDGGTATAAQIIPGGIAADGSGNLYISDTLDYRIRKVASGTISTVAGTGVKGFSGDGGAAISAQIGSKHGLAVDPAGNLYVADTDAGRIRKIAGGLISTVAGSGTFGYSGDGGPATAAQLAYPSSVATDNSNNFYIADLYNNRIRKVSSGVINLLAGGGPQNGATATAVSVYPSSVAVDASGNLYVPSVSDNRVYKVATNGTISTVAGNGTAGSAGDGGTAVNAQLNQPNGVAVDGAGNVYIADTNNNRIRKVSGGTISTVAGNGYSTFSGDGDVATNASLNQPKGVAVDSAGTNVYIADTYNGRIRKVTGGLITTVAGNGTFGYAGDGGQATDASLNYPGGVAVDSSANLYIADTSNGRIRKVTGGLITTVAGNGTFGYSGDGGTAVNAGLNQPGGVAVDGSGNLYIADYYNYRVRKVSGGVITTVAGTGANGYAGDGGQAASAVLSSPGGVAVDGSGNLFIADYNNYRVRKVAGGFISTVAGNGFASYSGDGGPAATAQLSGPSGLVVDGAGNVYFTESGSHRVRMISVAGVITTIAGTGVSGYSGDGGAATSAMLSYPTAIGVSNGNIYIADSGNNRLRLVSGGVISTVAMLAPRGAYSFAGEITLTVDSAGRVYVTNPTGGIVSLLNGTGPALLSVNKSHTGNFAQGQTGATYSVLVSNASGAGPTVGTVTLADTLPTGLSLVSMGGTGWSCTGSTCTTTNTLTPGSSYPAATVTVNVAANAPVQVTNQVTVSGGGSASASASDVTTINPAAQPPQVVSVTPASGSGASQTFSIVFSDQTAGSNLTSAYVSINDGIKACMVQADLVQGRLYLYNDGQTAWLGPITAGSASTLQNSQCTLNGTGSGVSVVGTQATLSLSLTFKAAFAGAKNVFGFVQNAGGLNSGWVSLGTWTVPSASQAPQAASVTPPAGSGLSQMFDFVFTDTYGGTDVVSAYASINDGAKACMVQADLVHSTLYLLNDAQTGWLGPMAVNNPLLILQNSQCTLSGNGTVITTAAAQVTVRLALTFKSAFKGAKNVFGYAQGAGGLNSGWTQLGTWTVPVAAPPQVVSVTPSSGSGVSQGFSFLFSDAAGGTDLAWGYASINNGVSSCMVQADMAQGLLYLMNDAMTAWLAPIAASSAATVQNSQCVLSAANSWVSATGTQALLRLDLTFKPAFAGPKNVFGYAVSASGPNSGWTSVGTWTVPGTQVVSVSPASGSGLSQTFSFVYSDGAGGADLAAAYASINDGVKACMVQADLVHGLLYLLNDAMTAWTGPITAGTATTLQNSQCTLTGTGSGAATSGNQVTLNLALTFKAAFAGTKNVFGYAQTVGGLSTGWASLGTWTVTGGAPPQVVSVTPSSGSGSSHTFSFVYSDPYGGTDLTYGYASINNGVTGCQVEADLLHGQLYLLNDAQTGWAGPIAAGTATTLQNSQCTVSGTGSSVAVSGNQATLSLNLAFKPAFAGAKNVFGYAQNAGGLNSGWIALGTWTAQ